MHGIVNHVSVAAKVCANKMISLLMIPLDQTANTFNNTYLLLVFTVDSQFVQKYKKIKEKGET